MMTYRDGKMVKEDGTEFPVSKSAQHAVKEGTVFNTGEKIFRGSVETMRSFNGLRRIGA